MSIFPSSFSRSSPISQQHESDVRRLHGRRPPVVQVVVQEPVPGAELKSLQHRGIVGQGQRVEHIAALFVSEHQRVL